MTMEEFRQLTRHIPDHWPLLVCSDNQKLFDVSELLVVPELGDRVVIMFNGEPAR